jgi:hypothetical protein
MKVKVAAMKINQLLSQSFYFLRKNVAIISLIMLPVIAPLQWLQISAMDSLLEQNTEKTLHFLFFYFAIWMAGFPIYRGCLILFIALKANDRPINLLDLVKIAAQNWLNILLVNVLLGSILLIAIILTAIAPILFPLVFAAIYLIARLQFSEFNVLFRQLKPMDAIKLAWEQSFLVKNQLIYGFLIVYSAIQIPAALLASALGEDASFYVFIIACFAGVALSWLKIYTYRLFTQLQKKE